MATVTMAAGCVLVEDWAMGGQVLHPGRQKPVGTVEDIRLDLQTISTPALHCIPERSALCALSRVFYYEVCMHCLELYYNIWNIHIPSISI